MDLPIARTPDEAQIYRDLHPCACGQNQLAIDRGAVLQTGERLAYRYEGTCPGCGWARCFVLGLSDWPLPPSATLRFGGEEPSEIIDAGEWLHVARSYATAATPTTALTAESRRYLLQTAQAAVDEVLKFMPRGQRSVPATAFWSAWTLAAFEGDPASYRKRALEAERRRYTREAERA